MITKNLSSHPAYKNPKLSIAERVADLIEQMTLREKVAQMLCIWREKNPLLFDEQGKLLEDALARHFKDGIGQIARISDRRGCDDARDVAQLANQLQHFFVEKTRLGVPVFFHEEGLHGLAAKNATSYPQPIGLAGTFNPQLVEQIYTAIAEDMRCRGTHQALTPVVDVARDPRWGRVEETFGEDPYLVAQMGMAAVRGFQGNGDFKDKKRVIATLKHFAAHGQPESGTNCAPVNVSERLLRDVFLYPFKEAVQKAGAKCVMASYNEIDGVPSHANKWLLRDVLRVEWGFTGAVVSDYYAIRELHDRPEATSHSVASDRSEAGLIAALAGVNIELPEMECYPNLIDLVKQGKVKESLIDELIAPLLRHKFELGLFEEPYVDVQTINNQHKLELDRKLALQAARETITLLKNDGQLPLDLEQCKTLAVIGPNADRVLLGGYSGKPKYYTSVLQGIKEKVGNRTTVLYSEGCKITVGGSWDEDAVIFADPQEDQKLIRQAIKTAQKADAIILALGGNEQTSREAWDRNHLGDRADLGLLGQQNDLAQALLGVGKPIIVLLFNGRPKTISYLHENMSAILECWYLGQETGHAVADVLFGDCNPAGKLPISFPRSVGHVPCYYNYKPSARRGYLNDEVSALYPFGYGLSYTTFKFSNLRLAKTTIRTTESTQALVDVKNSGKRSGEEVVQLYIRDLYSSVTRPLKELKGFKKIRLEPGESQTIAFPVAPEHLAFTDIQLNHTVEPGDFEIMVGNSSLDKDLAKIILHVR